MTPRCRDEVWRLPEALHDKRERSAKRDREGAGDYSYQHYSDAPSEEREALGLGADRG